MDLVPTVELHLLVGDPGCLEPRGRDGDNLRREELIAGSIDERESQGVEALLHARITEIEIGSPRLPQAAPRKATKVADTNSRARRTGSACST